MSQVHIDPWSVRSAIMRLSVALTLPYGALVWLPFGSHAALLRQILWLGFALTSTTCSYQQTMPAGLPPRAELCKDAGTLTPRARQPPRTPSLPCIRAEFPRALPGHAVGRASTQSQCPVFISSYEPPMALHGVFTRPHLRSLCLCNSSPPLILAACAGIHLPSLSSPLRVHIHPLELSQWRQAADPPLPPAPARPSPQTCLPRRASRPPSPRSRASRTHSRRSQP